MVTVGRILDLLAEACARHKLEGERGPAWTLLHMTTQERLAFDLFLVRTGDELASQAGTMEWRFHERVRRMRAASAT